MKTPSILLTLALSVASPLLWAHQGPNSGMATHDGVVAMGMSGAQSSSMRGYLERMQAITKEMSSTEDPAKRLKLMEEYRNVMHGARSMMGGGQGDADGMMGRGMGMQHGNMGMMGGQMACTGMLEAYRQMDKRLDLMQQMLERLQKGERSTTIDTKSENHPAQ